MRRRATEYVGLSSAGALNCSAVASNLACVQTDTYTYSRARILVRVFKLYAAICTRAATQPSHLYALIRSVN